MRIIGYSYQAALHCPCCTRAAMWGGAINPDPSHPYAHKGFDQEGIANNLVDREGNLVRPVFSTDEHDGDHCDDCLEELD